MAGRYAGTFYSDLTGENYLVTLGDSAFAGSISAFTIADIELTYDPETQDRFCPIIGSKLSLKVVINSAALETLVLDMQGAEEGRFTVFIVRNFTTVLFPFYVLMDLVEIEDAPYSDGIGYIFDIQCTDGIGRLKTIDYNDGGTAYTGYETFTDHIFNCLNKLTGLIAVYSSQYLLKVICNWREDSRTYSASDNPLDISRVNHEAFYTIDNNGLYVYKSCFDVLKEICTSWGARFIFSETSFWFIQLNELTAADSLTIYAYTKTQVKTVLSSQDISILHDQTDPTGTGVIKERGGKFGFFPPLRQIVVDYEHRTGKNLIAGATWPDSGTVTAIGIDYNGGIAKLAYTGRLVYATDPGAPTPSFFPLYLVFRITLKVGSKYFFREITAWPGGGPEYGPQSWENAPYWDIAVFVLSPGDNATVSITFTTLEIPASGDLEFEAEFLDAYSPSGTVIGGSIGTLEWILEENYLELLTDGSVSEQTKYRRFVNTNNTTGNSEQIVLPATIGDGPTITSPGHVEALNTAGTDWSLASQWRVGNSGTYKDRNRLLANEIIRGQLTHKKREYGVFLNVSDVYFAHMVIKRGSDFFVFQSGTIKLGADEVNGQWWNIATETSGWTEEALILTNSTTTTPSIGNSPSSGGGSGGTGGGVTTILTRFYAESFTGGDFSANAFTVTVNGGVLPTDSAQIMVFYNGVLTSEWTHTGSVITMSFQIYFSDVINIHFFINV